MERTIYELEAVIVDWKLQMSGSYRFVLQGKTGQTMNANCVDPHRVDPGSRWAKQIAAVRKEVEARLKPGPQSARVSQPVLISGIGFFNQLHGQLGVAPNGIELTPVLGIEWLS